MSHLVLHGLSKTFKGVEVLKDVHLQVEQGEFICLLGPSGSGKSTILRTVGGFETADIGTIELAGEEIQDLSANRRNIGIVFQDYALFPHLTVEENIEFGLKCQKTPKDEMKARVASVLELVGLVGLEKRYPKQLSGGQQQRVAIARGVALRPSLLLLDEPLSNLDAKLRRQIRLEMKELQQELGVATIMVTHDQEEAMTMGDRIAVLQQGIIQQIGKPLELYCNPANLFVAGFLGDPPINLYPCIGMLDEGVKGIEAFGRFWPVEVERSYSPLNWSKHQFVLGVRPENIEVVSGQDGILAKVEVIEHLGSSALIHVRTELEHIKLTSLVHSKWVPEVGDTITLQFHVQNCLLFDKETTLAVPGFSLRESRLSVCIGS